MRIEFARTWWMLALRGLIAIIFGVATLVWPGIALKALVLLFGVYALLDGVVALVVAIQTREMLNLWWVWLLEGLVGLAIGILTFLRPGVTEIALLYLIAAWAILTGAFEVVVAAELRKLIERDWLLALDGILSIILGVLLAIRPAQGALAVTWLIGLYAIVVGALLLVLAFRLRRLGQVLVQAIIDD